MPNIESKPTRQQIYVAIDEERIYQDNTWKEASLQHTNTEFLYYINQYLQKALLIDERQDPQGVATRDVLRKIAALAIAALEANGLSYRVY